MILTRDLMFASPIMGAAGRLGARVNVVGNLESMPSLSEPAQYCCVILDLGSSDVPVKTVVEGLRTAGIGGSIIAVGAHVHTARLREAADAGCHQVLPRSRFSSTLSEVLKSCLAS